MFKKTIRWVTLAACAATGAVSLSAQAADFPSPLSIQSLDMIQGYGHWEWFVEGESGSGLAFTTTSQDSNGPLSSTTVQLKTESPWLYATTASLLWTANTSLSPIELDGTQFVQRFTSTGSVLLATTNPGTPPGSLLQASITGGSITGQLGNGTGMQLTLNLAGASSDLLALNASSGTLSIGLNPSAGWSDRSALTCADPSQGCAGQVAYLGSMKQWTWGQASLSNTLFTSAVPEPATAGMVLLGLTALAWRRRV
jgi:hypothetical protein